MLNRNNLLLSMAAIIAAMGVVSQANAVPSQVKHRDEAGHCDPLFIPTNVDEIGDFSVFPIGEELEAIPLSSGPTVCQASDDPAVTNLVVDIINMTNKTFEQVWYVANRETDISNYDGFANDIGYADEHEAFRIDRLLSDPAGGHHPLIAESLTQDGKWEPGESWQFVLQDYSNTLGLSHADINSIGVGGASSALGITTSSGSIIAIVPEPATCLLMVLGLAGTLGRRFTGKN